MAAQAMGLTGLGSGLTGEMLTGAQQPLTSTGLMGGGGLSLLYKMRGQDDGAPAPGYVTWIATLPDFTGAQSGSSVPPIVGTLVPGSVVEVSRWLNPA